ncbi:AMP-binding protein [Desulfovibrio sp. OttesenSCG-928-A18]|nr:AMP-binding protein [Desulfovibrio sp. OttesenSCG-928-A18]
MTEPILPAQTLRHVLDYSLAHFADRPALSSIGDETPLTYRELHESASGLSDWLVEQGIGFGDTVAILSENSPHWGMAYFAITGMGAVAVPILTEFHADAVAHIIRHSGAKAVFVSEKLFPKIADAVFDPTPLFISIESFSPISQGMTRDMWLEIKSKGLREFRKWRDKAMRLAQRIPREPAEDDLAAIIYTSGTTGHSKGVMLSHRNIVANASAVRHIVHVDEYDRMLSILPLPHTFECTLGLVLPALHGVHVHYLDKPPTGRVLLPALARVRPTVMLSVPLVIEKIFKVNVLPKLTGNFFSRFFYRIGPTRKLMHRMAGKKLLSTFGGKLRLLAIGGAPMAADAERFLDEARFPYTVGYGLTEASPLLSGAAPGKTRMYSSGPAIPGVTLRIGDINPLSGEGEIEAYGPNIMQGYYKMPEISEEAFSSDHWLRTGDLGSIDRGGYVYIKGRCKNLILGPSGENIYPEEVESFFFGSPYVLEVLVYQHEGKLAARVHLDMEKVDEQLAGLGEKEMQEKRAALLEEMRSQVNGKVSSFARIHRIIEQVEPFEKTATHKIKRYLYVDS